MGLKILHLEDNVADAELLQIELQSLAPFEIQVAPTKSAYTEALKQGGFDLILSDYNVPGILGLESLELAISSGTRVPFIYVSGAVGEEGAIEMLKLGATDYVLKSKLEKLPICINRALQSFKDRALVEEKEQQIRTQEQEYSHLVNRMREGFVKISSTGFITIANPAALDLFRFDKQEFLGLNAKEILKLPVLDNDWNTIDETNSFERILTRNNGDRFWAHIGITPQIRQDGNFTGASAIIRDISIQKIEEIWKEILSKVTLNRKREGTSLRYIFEQLHKEIGNHMPNNNFFASTRNRDNSLQLLFIKDEKGTVKLPATRSSSIGLSGFVLRNNKAVWLNGDKINTFQKEYDVTIEGIVPKSIICVPIGAENEAKGVLGCLDYENDDAFNAFDFQVLKYVGMHLGNFVEKAESEQDRNRILELSQDLICIVEKDGFLRYTNPAFESNLGFDSSELSQLKADELLYANNPRAQKLMQKMLASGKRQFRFESSVKTKSGVKRYVSWTAISHEKDTSFYCIGHDFTEKRQIQKQIEESERRYRGLFERMTEGLFRSDENGIIRTVNPGLCHMVGYEKEELIGKNVYDTLVDESTGQRLRQKIKFRKEGKTGLYSAAFLHKDGHEVAVQVSATPDYDTHGTFIGVMSIIMDISERKRAEMEALAMKERFTRQLEDKVTERTQELEQAHIKLADSLQKEKELGRLKSRFVSTASHQFRTPLSVIQSNIGILSMQVERMDQEADMNNFKPKFDKIYHRIKEQIEGMTELMDDVLILGKINEGKVPIRMQVQALVPVCKNLIENFNLSEGKNIELKISGKPRMLNFNKKFFEEALSNIVSNAIKYSPEDATPQIEICFLEHVTNIKIQDEGVGIPESELEHVFEPFYRAKNAKEYGGTGLGTAIAKEYIELMGGLIEVQSELGKGSLFTIQLEN